MSNKPSLFSFCQMNLYVPLLTMPYRLATVDNRHGREELAGERMDGRWLARVTGFGDWRVDDQ